MATLEPWAGVGSAPTASPPPSYQSPPCVPPSACPSLDLVCEDAGKAYLCRLGLDAVRELGGTGVTSEAASSDDEDDAKLDAMASDLGRRRRTRSRGSFGALTLILQQVKRQVQKNIQECDSRVHSPSSAKSSLVPLSKTRKSVFCVVPFSRANPNKCR